MSGEDRTHQSNGMVVPGTVEADDRFTVPKALPKALLRQIGGKPGDQVTFRRTGPATVELRLPPQLSVDEDGSRRGPAQHQELQPLTPAEMLKRFKIEGLSDKYDPRQSWRDDAARDIIERMMNQ